MNIQKMFRKNELAKVIIDVRQFFQRRLSFTKTLLFEIVDLNQGNCTVESNFMYFKVIFNIGDSGDIIVQEICNA